MQSMTKQLRECACGTSLGNFTNDANLFSENRIISGLCDRTQSKEEEIYIYYFAAKAHIFF